MRRISRDARLLFVLIWTVVDDAGRCHGAPDELAAVLFPAISTRRSICLAGSTS